MPCCNQPGIKPAANNASNDSSGKANISLQLITDQIPSPIALGVPADGSNRLFICQKEGKVWIIENGKMLTATFFRCKQSTGKN